uniref:DUF38 domain-containing protein n=1 Tax=Panagrolaimus davidi TaxID=227884 RepID=A0A914QQU9_9BILA
MLLTYHYSKYLLSIIQKIVKCDLQILNIEGQTLTWEEYNFLTLSGTCKVVYLFECEIEYSDGSYVTADELFKNLQNIERFSLTFPENLWSTIQWESYAVKAFQSDTVKKMVQIFQSLSKLKNVIFDYVTEAFDFSSLSDFIMENKSVFIEICFDRPLSNDYKQMLQNFNDNIMENPPQKKPDVSWI